MRGLYWIAINGTTCSNFPAPLQYPFKVIPKPELLLGFPILKDAQLAEQTFFEESEEEFQHSVLAWMATGKVAMVRFDDPESPTDDQTIWLMEK